MSKRNKQKSKQRAKGQRQSKSPFGWMRSRQPDPAIFVIQAGTLLEAGKADEAIDLLEPLLEEYPRSTEILGTAGVAYLQVGDVWSAIGCFERAQKVNPAPVMWATLAGLYIQAGMNTYARDAIHKALKGMHEPEDRLALETMLAPIEHEIEQLTKSIGVGSSPKQIEIGLRHHDDAQRAIAQSDMQATIDANRRAIRFLGDWPPAHNNLAQALLYNGQHAEAIATTNNVLAQHAENLHALSNGIKFYAWSGKADEARALWERLRLVEPSSDHDRVKFAEAAAVMEEDESVYQALYPLVGGSAEVSPILEWQILFHFAVAKANTKRIKSALKHLRELDEENPRVHAMLEALKAKRPGLGWSMRYPYFALSELMPLSAFAEVEDLVTQQEEVDEARFQKRVERFLQRYPQLLLVVKKLIWEEMQPQFGVPMLAMMGTPEAHALLQEFGFSQVGSDQDRMDALLRLREANAIDASEPVRIWSDGEWREVKLISYEISDEPDVVYSPTAVKIYERALDAYHQGKYEEAEQLLKQVIALEPQAADAYFNLAVTHAARGDHEQAKALCLKSIEIKPMYAMPRCQLAQSYLREENVEAAREILLPLTEVTRFSTIEATMYMFTQARILIAEEEYTKARALLESLLTVDPEFAPAQNLLDRVQLMEMMSTASNSYFEDMRLRQERRRLAQQSKLKTVDVTVDMALGIFTRDVQRTIAPHILQHGGWSTLKKKELHNELVQSLRAGQDLDHTITDLNKKERAALRAVLKRGGVMPWNEFSKRYGNDLEENSDWQYHEPATLMGRLRQRVLLSVATVDGETFVVVPIELRTPLAKLL